MNPLIPTISDGVFASIATVGFLLAVFAFVSLIATRNLPGREVILWTVAIFVVPFVGAVTWLAVKARRAAPRPLATESDHRPANVV